MLRKNDLIFLDNICLGGQKWHRVTGCVKTISANGSIGINLFSGNEPLGTITFNNEQEVGNYYNIIKMFNMDINNTSKIVTENDAVNHPSHYTDGKIEVIDFIEDKHLDFHRGNAVKYIARAGKKNPDKEIEDLQKAVWYLQREIERLNKEVK